MRPPWVGLSSLTMKTSEAVLQLREAAKLSQDDFGERIGLNGRRVCQVENGSGTFRPGVIVRICEEFRREMASLGITPLDFSRVE